MVGARSLRCYGADLDLRTKVFQLYESSTDEPFGYEQIALPIHGHPVRAVEQAGLEKSSGDDIPGPVLAVRPPIVHVEAFVVPQITNQVGS